MIHVLILTGLMAITQIEAVSVQAVHNTYENILGVVLLVTDLVDTSYNGAISSKVQVIRDCLEVPKVVTKDNTLGFSAEGWIL